VRLRGGRPGVVVLPVAEYDALVAAAARAGHPAQLGRAAEPAGPVPAADVWLALGAAVACVTARVSRAPVDLDDLTADVPAAPLVRILATLAASALRELTADQGASILTDLGLLAAGPGDDDER